MQRVVGIFDAQYVDETLAELYEHGFPSEDITVIDRQGSVTGPNAAASGNVSHVPLKESDASIALPPASVGTQAGTNYADNLSPAGGAFPAIGAAIFGLTAGVDTNRAMEFYRHAIERGASLIVVRANDVHATHARMIMRRHHASNISEDPNDRTARV